jgi:hypothetical protein
VKARRRIAVGSGERAECARRLTEGRDLALRAGSPASFSNITGAKRARWWWFFERCEKMTDEELLDDAESISGLVRPVKSTRTSNRGFTRCDFRRSNTSWASDTPSIRPRERRGTIVAMDERPAR